MIHQQDGNESKEPTAFPVINIYAYSKTKEDAASSASDLLTLFVPKEIWPWTTITVREEYAGSFAIHVTTASSGT